jgi:NAD(P)-dependent dehydrogenase (short-subunit alcohol dehydrogenase family)
MLLACGLGAKGAELGIRVYGVDPGLVRTDIGNKDAGGLVGYVWERRKNHGVDPSVPAEIYARLICPEESPAGLYHSINGPAAPSRQVNIRNAERLFKLSEKLCNIRFGVYDECMS